MPLSSPPFFQPRIKSPSPRPTLSQNWQTGHHKCLNQRCKYQNPPQVAAGTYQCGGCPNGFYCEATFEVTPMDAQSAETAYRMAFASEPNRLERSPRIVKPNMHPSMKHAAPPFAAHQQGKQMQYYTNGDYRQETKKELEVKLREEQQQMREEKKAGRLTVGRRNPLEKRFGVGIWAATIDAETETPAPPKAGGFIVTNSIQRQHYEDTVVAQDYFTSADHPLPPLPKDPSRFKRQRSIALLLKDSASPRNPTYRVVDPKYLEASGQKDKVVRHKPKSPASLRDHYHADLEKMRGEKGKADDRLSHINQCDGRSRVDSRKLQKVFREKQTTM